MPRAKGKKHKPGGDGLGAPGGGGGTFQRPSPDRPWQMEGGSKRAGGSKEKDRDFAQLCKRNARYLLHSWDSRKCYYM